MVKTFTFLQAAAVVLAVPAIVYETVDVTVFETEYLGDASAGAPGVGYSTLWPSSSLGLGSNVTVSSEAALPAFTGGASNFTAVATAAPQANEPGQANVAAAAAAAAAAASSVGSTVAPGNVPVGAGSNNPAPKNPSAYNPVPFTPTSGLSSIAIPAGTYTGVQANPTTVSPSDGSPEYVTTEYFTYTSTVEPSKVKSTGSSSTLSTAKKTTSGAAPRSSSSFSSSSASSSSSSSSSSTSLTSTPFNSSSTSTSTSSGTSANTTSSDISTITSSATTISSSSTTSSSTSSSASPSVTIAPSYMVYSPFNADQSCKDYDTVFADLLAMKNKGIFKIRMYATDCNSLYTVQPAAKLLGMKIMQGVWIGTQGLENAYNQLDAIVGYHTANNLTYDIYESIAVGNEDVTNGYVSASELVEVALNIKSYLRTKGYTGPVVTPETTGTIINNAPYLCNVNLGFIALNAHSYFAPTFTAQESGEFILNQIGLAQAACDRTDVFISETGYPWKGDVYGNQVPSRQNQADAVNSILEVLGGNAVILAEYDDLWKAPGPYNIEQHFGVLSIINVD